MRLSLAKYPIAILFLFAVMIGCNKSNPPVNAEASTATLTGDWVVIADTAGQGHTGRLTLNPEGTFSMSYSDKHSNDSASGKYIVGEIELSGQKFKTVELSTEVYNGKPAPSSGPLRLVYDPGANILHDFLTVAYARPDEVEQAKKLFERKTITSPSISGASLKTRMIWKTDFPNTEKLFLGMAIYEPSDGGTSQIIALDAKGWRVLDNSGKPIGTVSSRDSAGSDVTIGELDGKPVLVQFGTWGTEVLAFDLDGKPIWSYQAIDFGIDWLAPVRLGPKNTGYAISYNGGGGVELLTPNGKRRWLVEAPWNAWSVTGLRTNKSVLVVAVGSSKGAVAWDLTGKMVREYACGDAGSVGAADVDGDGQDELLTLGTTIASGLKLSVFSADGSLRWSKKANATEGAFLSSPFLVGSYGVLGRLVGVAGGRGISFFEPDGKLKGILKFDEELGAVCVLHRKGKPDALVVRFSNRVECIELSEQ